MVSLMDLIQVPEGTPLDVHEMAMEEPLKVAAVREREDGGEALVAVRHLEAP
jgi:hypothetical protein